MRATRGILLALLLSLLTASGFCTTTVQVYIDGARAAHTFSIVSTNGDGSWAYYGFDPSGFAYGDFSYDPDPSSPGNYFLFDQTVGEYLSLDSVVAAGDTQPASLTTAQWVDGNGNPSPRRYFCIGADRAGHVFLAYSDGSFCPVSSTNRGNYIEASAEVGQAMEVTLIDANSHEQLATNAVNGYDGAWYPASVSLPMVTIYAIVPDSRLNWTFALSSGAYFYSGAATAMQIPSLGGATRTAISTVLPLNEFFQITLYDYDQSYSANRTVDAPVYPWEQVFDFSTTFPDPPPPNQNWGWYYFNVGENHFSDTFVVEYNGTSANSEDSGGSGVLTTWDDYGNAVNYNYKVYQAWIDLNYSATVTSAATSDPMDGFQPWHPSPPAGFLSVSLFNDRVHDTIYLQQDDGTTWIASIDPNYEWAGLTYHVHETIYTGTADEQVVDYDIGYAILNVPYDPSQGATIYDTTRGDSIQPSINSGEANLATWTLAPTEIQLQISLTRLGEALEIHTSRGSIYPVDARISEGYWSVESGGFIPYYYFRGYALTDPGFEWWLYDPATGATSPRNQWDYTTWHSAAANDDLDGDGLPDWYEGQILHTSTDTAVEPGALHANGWDTDHDGVSDLDEVLLGLDPLNAAIRDSATVKLTIYTLLE